MAKRKRQHASARSNTFKAPTVGEVREFLGRYDEEQPFFIPNVQDDSATRNSDIEFYHRMYRTLHPQFTSSCSTSVSNSKRIQLITGGGLDSIFSEIMSWRDNPRSFWEAQAKTLPEYSSLNRKERLAGFISRAISLESETMIQQIQKRFVAVSAYRFFQKAVPTSEHTVLEAAVLKFLRSIRLSESSIETTLKTCAAIIQRGHRCLSFCKNLPPLEDGCIDYGLLLDPELPDTIFDDKKRLSGKPRKTAIEHLKKSWRPSCLHVAQETARILIEYNEAVCWIDDTKEQDSSGSRTSTSLITLDQETSATEPYQQADTGRLRALAAAAEVSRPTTQQGPNSNDNGNSDHLGGSMSTSNITRADGGDDEIEGNTDDASGPGSPENTNNSAPNTGFGDHNSTGQRTPPRRGDTNEQSLTEYLRETIQGFDHNVFSLNQGSSLFDLTSW